MLSLCVDGSRGANLASRPSPISSKRCILLCLFTSSLPGVLLVTSFLGDIQYEVRAMDPKVTCGSQQVSLKTEKPSTIGKP